MSPPLLLIGVGDQGKRVGEHFARELSECAPRYRAIAKAIYEPAPESYREAIHDLLRSYVAQGQKPGDPVQTWIVADLTEAGIAGRVSSQSDQLKNSIQTNFPEVSVNIDTVLFLPKGTPEDRRSISTLLDNLAKGCSPCRFCWLLSRGRHLLDDDELSSVAARFLLLTFLGDLSSRFWAHGNLDSLKTRLGTIGLSGVVVPAKERARQETAKVAAAVLDEALTDNTASVDPRLFEDFARSGEISSEELKRALEEGTQISFSERNKKIDLEASAPASWPDRLWSIYYFFAFGGLAGYFDRIRQNREKKWQVITTELGRVVDSQMEKNVPPSMTLALLRQFETRVAGLKGDKVNPASGKDLLQSAIEALKQAYRFLPLRFGSLALRVVFLALMLGYLFAFVIPLVVDLPEAFADYYFFAFLALSVILAGLAGILFYMKKRNRFSEAKARAEGALWTALESALDARAHNEAIGSLEKLQGVCASSELVQNRSLNSSQEVSEYSRVLRFMTELKAAAQCLKIIANQDYAKTPLLRYVEPQVLYKDGEYSIPQEAKLFVENGLYKGWRDISAEKLVTRTLELASAGLNGAKDIDEILAGMREDDVKQLGLDLLEMAAPLAAPASSGDGAWHEERYLLVNDASNSPLVSKSTLRDMTVLSTEDPHRLFLLRTYLGISPEDIVALRSWNEEKSHA